MTDTTDVGQWISPANLGFPVATPAAPGGYEATREDYFTRFSRLVRRWRSETIFMSRVDDKINHPAFRQITELKDLAVPLILKEIAVKPDHLYLALQVITGENPVSAANRGHLNAAVDAWISWGQRNDIGHA